MEKETLYCYACGIEIDASPDEVIYMDELPFCTWCWCNDCCRASRDAAEEKEKEED